MNMGAVAPRATCAVCEMELSVTWSDTHGVGVCWTCGLPYRLYHYENDKRVEKPPSLAVGDEWLPLARKYWAETQRRVFPAVYDIRMERGGRTYSGASREDCELFDEWMEAHKAEWPKRNDEAQSAANTPSDEQPGKAADTTGAHAEAVAVLYDEGLL